MADLKEEKREEAEEAADRSSVSDRIAAYDAYGRAFAANSQSSPHTPGIVV